MAPSVVATSVLAGGPAGAGGAVVVVVVAIATWWVLLGAAGVPEKTPTAATTGAATPTAMNPAPARTPIRRRPRPIRPPLDDKGTGRCGARGPGGGRMPGMAGRQRISSGSP